jgi:hypothetical protein
VSNILLEFNDNAHPPQAAAAAPGPPISAPPVAAPSVSAPPVAAPSISAPPQDTTPAVAAPHVVPHVTAPGVATTPVPLPSESISSAMEDLNLGQDVRTGIEHLAAAAANDARPCPKPKA